MVFVTVNCVPLIVGAFGKSAQSTGGLKLGVVCKVNPKEFAGHEMIRSFNLKDAL